MKDDVLVGLSPVAERYIRQLESELEKAKQVAARLVIRAEAVEATLKLREIERDEAQMQIADLAEVLGAIIYHADAGRLQLPSPLLDRARAAMAKVKT